MPQITVWNPTRAFLKSIVRRLSSAKGHPVKRNEVVHQALIDYASNPKRMGMTQAEIDAELAAAAQATDDTDAE